MSYCLNPVCNHPQNQTGTKFCVTCGTKLLLKERYRSLKPIGEGGFGKTFLAEDTDRLNAYCVIKQFLPIPDIQGNSGAMSKATELFEQEARQLLQLGEQHPQIPTLFAYFEQDKRLYLVQQYIDGQDLSKELEEKGAFSEEQIKELLNDLLPILRFVHEHQVIHRDIKPTNIVRRKSDGKLVLIDFGVSKQLTATAIAHTGTRTGTEGYAAIEQLRGGKAFPASDLYSLGVSCIHLLTGVGFDELYDPLEGVWVWREYIRKQGKEVSDRLTQVIDKLLQDYVKHRYQSATEVLQDLNAVAEVGNSSTNPEQTTTEAGKKQNVTTPPPPAKPKTWRCIQTINGHSRAIFSVAMSLNGEVFASGSHDTTVKLWDLKSGTLIRTFTGHKDFVRCVAISPDGKTLASCSDDRTIKVWAVDTGQLRHTLTGHSGWVYSVAFSPDGKVLASSSRDKTIQLWNVTRGQLNYVLTGHSGCIRSIVFYPNGKILASGSDDETIKLWTIDSGKVVPTFVYHSSSIKSLAISRNGNILASSSYDGTIKLWQIERERVKFIHAFTGHSKSINAVCFSPDEQILASGSDDQTIKFWQVDNCDLLHTLKGHSIGVSAVAFAPDGQTLVSGSYDQTIKIWRLSP